MLIRAPCAAPTSSRANLEMAVLGFDPTIARADRETLGLQTVQYRPQRFRDGI
jgi:hypothetical protein